LLSSLSDAAITARVLVLVVLLALVGAVVVSYYLNYSPDRTIHAVRGIDVSHHQGVINWGKVAKSDVAFAILKATEGGDYVDETFARNLTGAKAAGLVVGAYHFFTFCRAGTEQAANFLKVVPRNMPMLPPVVDIEFVGNCAARPPIADLQRELTAFLTPVEAAFRRPAIVYVMDPVAAQYQAAIPNRPRWVRSLGRRPGNGDWVLWQYDDAGHVDGIERAVDLNLLRGGADALEALAGG
jgi:lysozyme